MKLEDKIKAEFEGKNIGLTFFEYATLCKWIDKLEVKDVAEIGTGTGGNAYCIMNFTNTENLICFDGYFDEGHPLYDKNIGKFIPDKEIIEMMWPEDKDIFIKECQKNNTEFAFLDDGHAKEIVYDELIECANLNIPYIALHDVDSDNFHRCIIKSDYKPIARCQDGQGLYLLKLESY